MTEPLCSAHFSLSKKQYYEATRLVYRSQSGKTLGFIFLGLAILWAILTVITMQNGGTLIFAAIELAVIALAWLWANILIPNGKARRAWDRLGGYERTVELYADSISVISDERRTDTDYSKISKTLSSKDLIVCVTDENSGIIIERNSFTKGSAEKALELIKTGRENKYD